MEINSKKIVCMYNFHIEGQRTIMVNLRAVDEKLIVQRGNVWSGMMMMMIVIWRDDRVVATSKSSWRQGGYPPVARLRKSSGKSDLIESSGQRLVPGFIATDPVVERVSLFVRNSAFGGGCVKLAFLQIISVFLVYYLIRARQKPTVNGNNLNAVFSTAFLLISPKVIQFC